MLPGPERRGSVEDFEAEFFDDRIREDVFGNAFHLALRFRAAEAVQLQDEKLSLAHTLHLRMTERRERALNRLSLRIKDGWLRHDPDVCFHVPSRVSRAIIAGSPILPPHESPQAIGASRWAAGKPR